jgi:hypothetical protein
LKLQTEDIKHREERAKKTLFENHMKWSSFSKDLIQITKQYQTAIIQLVDPSQLDENHFRMLVDKVNRFDANLSQSNDQTIINAAIQQNIIRPTLGTPTYNKQGVPGQNPYQPLNNLVLNPQ